jgi:hypothetical protein
LIKNNNVLAANNNESDKINKLPFELKTSNITQYLLAGDFVALAKNIEIFFSTPFYISSEFNHSKFLDSLGWKAIVKIDKLSFFTDFIYKLAAFMFAFFIWAMFLKSFEATLMHFNAFNEKEVQVEDDSFKVKYLERSLEKQGNFIKDFISEVKKLSKFEDWQFQPVRSFKLDNPYEELVVMAQEVDKSNDSFLKLQVYFENEEYFLNEMSKYINRNIEDIMELKSQVDEIKRVLLNIQIKHNLPERQTREVELKLNRLILSSSDIKKGLESIKEKNKDSKSKRALAWGEYKDHHLNFMHKNKKMFDMSEERYHVFNNEIKSFNQKLQEQAKISSDIFKSLEDKEQGLSKAIESIEKEIIKDKSENEDAA